VAAAVDRARRELAVERALARVDAAWATLALAFAPHPATATPLLTVPPALSDALESDAVALQNLASGKLAQANADFGARVAAWQARLATVDALLAAWTTAQRKWTALHAVFTASADLRAALPAACARFDAGDAEFRAVATDAPATPLAVDAAAVPGRRERLEGALRALEDAERALQSYLEAKRVAFPRFYFVSPADLLDILARGGDPHAVVK
jgi:dynein heavy chain